VVGRAVVPIAAAAGLAVGLKKMGIDPARGSEQAET